jgi:hypothetical protein
MTSGSILNDVSSVRRARSLLRASRANCSSERGDATRAVAQIADAHAELAPILDDQGHHHAERNADSEQDRSEQAPEQRGRQESRGRDAHSDSTATPIT